MLNSRDLKDLRADVRANVEILLGLCRSQEMAVLITQTKRDNEYQAYLYAQGRTRPGSIVTNSKTTTFHGAGLAVDFCENIKGREYADASFFQNVAIIAKAMGFSWGGDWKSFPDFPHLQWDDRGKYTTAMLRAGKVCPTMPRYEGPRKTKEDEGDMKRYNTIEEIKQGASWAVDTVRKLMDRKIITGNGVGLNLSEDMLRLLVFNDRAGLYK
ncbi:MAG: M15 family metallopeptidase [Clostridia bacterium]|nr:M15 family metallopeptidase [Clostridia bacterium]